MPMETAHIWLGQFHSEEKLVAYLEEQYDNDEVPISQFAADQNESYYDHDWVEYNFCVSHELFELIDGASYSNDYLDEVIEVAAKIGIESANTFIMADFEEFDKPKSVNTHSYKLWYIGTFKCKI
ncbi:MAG TPA: hypothetical protein DD473_02560 [Planctomycetaceae bacterium]|uniref:immunity 22 family protein n=1 Tax=Rubinisphaera sp. TaxID=2024857 RepID=UPI000C0F1AC0|nr:immunity 22 family protein [Rubinisphaera sp.]MBV08628.1 hypothetical protein [Rubinisphaera sp.]HBN74705.1 hypothetical protein [Planctomycetaceae bacterium]HCS51952.1 hypothetical protein [Planctomycetaceae bacterium]|tara:strand:+ start:275 stop:649 length:375 start_codon:yes stop_codon:yes gene_type:complete